MSTGVCHCLRLCGFEFELVLLSHVPMSPSNISNWRHRLVHAVLHICCAAFSIDQYSLDIPLIQTRITSASGHALYPIQRYASWCIYWPAYRTLAFISSISQN